MNLRETLAIGMETINEPKLKENQYDSGTEITQKKDTLIAK